jgi:NNP family nitrate/nitrite transporter-like MFS transporter
MCGFGVWVSWGVVAVLLLQVGFPYTLNGLFSIIAIAGMAGGSLRIALGFLSPHLTSSWALGLPMVLLMIPALGMAMALQRDTPLWILQMLALVSGLGGGCYSLFSQRVAASAHRHQNHAGIGLGTGLGQLAVAASQMFLPWVVTFNLRHSSGQILVDGKGSSTLLGAFAGEILWISNIGWVWFVLLIVLLFLLATFYVWEMLSPVHLHRRAQRKTYPSGAAGLGWASVGWALFVGLLVTMLGCWLTLPADANGVGLQVSRELVLAAMVIIMLALLRVFPTQQQDQAHSPHSIFNNKHTWLMSVMYSMSLGTFFGLAAALPLTLEWTFGYVSAIDGLRQPNPNAPRTFTYVWMAPLVGLLMRPVGGWVADRFGGARTTQYCAVVMMLAAAGAAFYLAVAYRALEPEQYFFQFFMLTFLLFAAAGAAHASVLLTVERLFPANQLRYLNVWMAGIAAYGMFYIPGLLADQLQRGTPEQAMISFALFYALCLLLNGWFYLRRDGTFYNP